MCDGGNGLVAKKGLHFGSHGVLAQHSCENILWCK